MFGNTAPNFQTVLWMGNFFKVEVYFKRGLQCSIFPDEVLYDFINLNAPLVQKKCALSYCFRVDMQLIF